MGPAQRHNVDVIPSQRWIVFCFLDARGRNVIRDWLHDERVPLQQVAAFQEKIDALESGGPEMVPGFITETPVARDIYKMKVKGNKGMKQLRPMCLPGTVRRSGVHDPGWRRRAGWEATARRRQGAGPAEFQNIESEQGAEDA